VISINLLPAEYRKAEATPVARFVAIVAGAVLLTSGLVTYGFVHYSKLRGARDVLAATEETYKNKKTLADQSLALQAEVQAYETRRKAIQDVAGSRVLWSKKLDQMLDIFHNRGDRAQYFVWLNGLKVSPSREASRKGEPNSGGTVAFSGYTEGGDPTSVTNLRSVIRKDVEFYEDFKSLSMPVFDTQRWDDGKEPSVAGKFAFDLTLKAPGWRRTEKKDARKN
jgi:hypothetical protein